MVKFSGSESKKLACSLRYICLLWFALAAGVVSAAQAGKVDFLNACAVCHAAEPDRPGTMSLQFKYAGRLPAALEQRTDLTPEMVTYYVRHGIAMMPSFRKTELSDAQVAAIAAYLSRSRGLIRK